MNNKVLAICIGNRIRETRRQMSISQDKLALNAEIDRSYMGRIERGEVCLTVEKLYEIANALDCDPKIFLP